MHTAPILTGNPRTDQALLTLARLAAEIARARHSTGGVPSKVEPCEIGCRDAHDTGCAVGGPDSPLRTPDGRAGGAQ